VFNRLSAWDYALTRHLTLAQDSRWRGLSTIGAHLGDGPLWLIAGTAALIWGTSYLRRITLITVIAVLVTMAVATTIKYAVRRQRPRELPRFYSLKHDRYSFPSGHATRVATISATVGYFAPPLAPVSYALAVLVGLCRVQVGVHYASDVLAGLVIGWLGGWGVLLAIQAFQWG
jgi:undecaprenyl-diphosphatase